VISLRAPPSGGVLVSPLAERSVASLDREELQTVSERWRQTRGIKDREMTFLTRPATLDDEIDVRKFFSFDQEGRLQAFAFSIRSSRRAGFWAISAQPSALVGYAVLHRALRTFQDEGKVILSLGLSPLCAIEDNELSSNRLVSLCFRALYRSRLFNKLIYPLQGFAAHKGAFCGSAEQTYRAFKRGLALSQLLPRACNLA
jgi:lysylphosphatidylglycerol synthetase-like protein (DUF2156 family)